jgi:hypothetical protein
VALDAVAVGGHDLEPSAGTLQRRRRVPGVHLQPEMPQRARPSPVTVQASQALEVNLPFSTPKTSGNGLGSVAVGSNGRGCNARSNEHDSSVFFIALSLAATRNG